MVRIEPETHRVVVGPASALGETEVHLAEVNWLGDFSDGLLDVKVKVRSTQDPVPASVKLNKDGTAAVNLNVPERAIAPGQPACSIRMSGC